MMLLLHAIFEFLISIYHIDYIHKCMKDLGSRITEATVEKKAKSFLFQSLSMNLSKKFTIQEQFKLKKFSLNPCCLSSFLLFYNILNDCHNSDEINYLLNAFRLKKVCIKVCSGCYAYLELHRTFFKVLPHTFVTNISAKFSILRITYFQRNNWEK